MFHRPFLTCFYCQSAILTAPQNVHHFQCPHCTCWNHYDAKGDILSDEPAMRDEALNAPSFAKRASPTKHHLPSAYSRGPFCHTCQTNQTLLVNLLSNYLPPPEHPTYEPKLASLPAYTSSLQTRYPPVCADCLPAVEEEIKKKDHMARTLALGGVLKESRGKDKARLSEQALARQRLSRQLLAWRARGFLWLASLLVAVGGSALGAFDMHPPRALYHAAPILPFITLISVAWAFWDPTFSLSKRSRQQGREVRVGGRRLYIRLQLMSWTCRLATAVLIFCAWLRPHWDLLRLHLHPDLSDSHDDGRRKRAWFASSLALELSIIVLSYFSIRIHQPPAVRLVDTTVHLMPPRPPGSRAATAEPPSRATSPRPLEPTAPDLLATLSLSPNPAVAGYAVNPIFGRPSLHVPGSSASQPPTRASDPDAMDWEPASGGPEPRRPHSGGAHPDDADDGVLLRPQRFFAPEQPTGLEGLLMRTRLMDDDSPTDVRPPGGVSGRGEPRWNWFWVYALSLVPLALVAGILWNRRVDM